MIPSIEDIIAGLVAGSYTAEQATAWLNRHVELAAETEGLRDLFAASALQSLVNGPAAQNICDRDPRYDETNFAHVVALNAYEFADAMLKARTA